jgi:drug/metabolite transporter (DMT)-like permease
MANNLQYPKTNPGKLGALLIAAGATLISFSGVYVKLAHVSPTVAGFYRTFFGGIILLVIGWVLITKGLPKIKSSLTGLLLLLQPALAFVWDMLFFDRKTSIVGGIGAVFTLAAIYMGATSHSDSKC